jgi:hypothetical protein
MNTQKALIGIGASLGLNKVDIKRVADTVAAMIKAEGTPEPVKIVPQIAAVFDRFSSKPGDHARYQFALIAYGVVMGETMNRCTFRIGYLE